MKVILYLFYLLVAVIPGILLLFASSKFRSHINTRCGNLMITGSVLVLLHLMSGTGNYLIASFGSASDLAIFAQANVWVSGILKYLGLVLLGVGLLLFVRKRKSKSIIDQVQ